MTSSTALRGLGLGMRAARDLFLGSVVLREKPIVAGCWRNGYPARCAVCAMAVIMRGPLRAPSAQRVPLPDTAPVFGPWPTSSSEALSKPGGQRFDLVQAQFVSHGVLLPGDAIAELVER